MNNLSSTWAEVLDYCKTKVAKTTYEVWIKCIEPVSAEGDLVTLLCPNNYNLSFVENNFSHIIRDGFREATGEHYNLRFVEEYQLPPAVIRKLHPAASINEEYTFDNFIVGTSNKFAHAASQAVAAKPGIAYNPLFIYGASGLGKTHLLCAIKNEIARNNPGMNIIYIKGDDFTSELIEAIRNSDTTEFKRKYRTADVLLVDDINYISGKTATQEEFFHTFNTLFQDKKQLVFTSDRPPKEILTLEERLRTRFEWGLLADIQSPDIETRIAIIKRKAESYNLEISDDVCNFIASRIKTNVRLLESTVKKMNAYYLLNQEKPSMASAQNAIRDIFSDSQPTPITVDRIISEVARTFEVSSDDIKSTKRSAQVSAARQTAMYIIREITPMSLALIGKEFGGRDHSTIVYALAQTEKNMKKNASYKAIVDDIIKNIRDKN
ncbi:MAG: chromosomal replication initiator protein DnaA [Clostridia bacterium]|nr:chromosomal replication initiator protein DnaA [Clostridia bacterium]